MPRCFSSKMNIRIVSKIISFVAREVKSKKREHFEDVGRKISRLGYNTFPHYQQMVSVGKCNSKF